MSTDPPGSWRSRFLGLDLLVGPVDALAEAVATLRTRDGFNFVVTPNVDHVVKLAREPQNGPLRDAYRRAALRLCDSKVLAILARLCGERVVGVTGTDVVHHVLGKHVRPGDSLAVIGGDDETLEHLARCFPGPRFVQHIPPMGILRNTAAQRQIAEFIEQARADYIIFAIGSPQSEIVCALVAARGKASGVALCVGAAVEFITGRKPRAPVWMQRFALEWLHRLLSEPRRLWRRYLVEGPAVFGLVLRWRITGRPV